MKERLDHEAAPGDIVSTAAMMATTRKDLAREAIYYRGISVFTALASVYVGYETLPALIEYLQVQLPEEGLMVLNDRAAVAAALPAALVSLSIMSWKAADQRSKAAREEV